MDPDKKENRKVRKYTLTQLEYVVEVTATYKDKWTYEEWLGGEVPASELVEELTDLIDKLMRARTRMSYYTEKRRQ